MYHGNHTENTAGTLDHKWNTIDSISHTSGCASTIGTLVGSSSVTGFDRDALFIWGLSWFTSLSFFWTTSLTGTLGGTAGGLDFMNISPRVSNDSLCHSPNFTKVLAGAGFYSEYIRSCEAC